MKQRRNRRRGFTGQGRRGIIAAATLAAGLALVAPLLVGLTDQGTAGAAPEDSVAPTAARTTPLRAPEPIVLGRSEPESITIPAIGVGTDLVALPKEKGKDTIQLPKDPRQPGWFEESATPGELGITTIIGYIAKSNKEPGVFSKIAKLEEGDTITVTRADGRAVEFTVDSIDFYPEGEFPADEVYEDPDRPALRLITSGGTIHPDDPPGNLVVSARMTGS
ncbi:MAG TPA: sortase [Bacillota bacterium]|nr:sortase [Bacillota bacterium]